MKESTAARIEQANRTRSKISSGVIVIEWDRERFGALGRMMGVFRI